MACQTCHTTTYFENTCYGCHDHEPAEMKAVHEAEGITEMEKCGECHPTGVSGEAERLGYGLGGQSGDIEVPGLNPNGQLPGGGAEVAPLGEEGEGQPGPAGEQEPPQPGAAGDDAPASGQSQGD